MVLIIDGANIQAHRVVDRKSFRKHLLAPERRRGRAKSLKDWEIEEQTEPKLPPLRDIISDWVGTRYYYANYSDLLWRNDLGDRPVEVDRYYPHEELIVDFPRNNEETQRRAQLFDQLGIKYMYVDFNEEMTERQFKERLNIIRRDHAKAISVLAGHGVHRTG